MALMFDSTDLDAVEAFLGGAYSSMRLSTPGERGGLRVVQEQLAGARLDHVTYRMQLDIGADPLGALAVGRVTNGGIRYRDRHGERVYRQRDIFLVAQPDDGFHASADEFECHVAMIDLPSLQQVAETAPGDDGPVRLLAHDPVTHAAGQQWWRTYEAVDSWITTGPDLLQSPLVAASAARLLAAVTLVTFPNTTLVDPTIEDRHDAHPETLRRAIEFIESNPHRDVSVADIAAACSVTVRAVQLAFRRHLDTTPMSYLRRVRLQHAHEQLRDADPGHGDTVTAIAARWGFANPSRFTAYYRREFGRPPSQTLRT